MACPAPIEGAGTALEQPPLGLYVHLPWCVRKCPYCDFNSHRAPAVLPVRDYLDALDRDLAMDAPLVAGRVVETVFFGGGTPSLFGPGAFAELLAGIRRRVRLAAAAEITLEANPGTLEHAPFAEYRAAGITRLSVGVQSFDDRSLSRLGRVHDVKQARDAVIRALDAGFGSVNVDLMYGLPGQDPAGALADLRQALELGVPHVSHYQLTLEPNTLFHARPPALPDDEVAWAMQQQCQEILQRAGLRQYEVSAYARHGHECRHNLNYWCFGDYLGIGAGAHGKLTDGTGGSITRTVKVRHPRAYLEQAGGVARVLERRSVRAADRSFEFVLGALRLPGGFETAAYERRTGLQFDASRPPWADLLADGLLATDGPRVAATDTGFRYLDDVLSRFLPDAD